MKALSTRDNSVTLWFALCFASAWWDAWFGIDLFNKFGVGFPYQHFLGAILSLIWVSFWWMIFGRITLGNIGLLLIGLAISGMGANLLREIYRIATGTVLNPAVVEWWQGVHIPMGAMWIVNLIVLFVGCAFTLIAKGTDLAGLAKRDSGWRVTCSDEER